MVQRPNDPQTLLKDRAATLHPSSEWIASEVQSIQRQLLAHSPHVRTHDFSAIHTRDLQFLFHAYDKAFFSGLCQSTLGTRALRFHLSSRMTKTGGTTTRFRDRDGGQSFEIAIAIRTLFDGFGEQDRETTVTGIVCRTRLDALQRIFEHELVHLVEYLCWEVSDCSAPVFQSIATRLFQHRAHTHDLVTWRERAAVSGVRVGAQVSFTFEGRRLTGRVNQITRRATVLVPDPEGLRYSDGQQYRKYYVPVAGLTLVSYSPTTAKA